MRYFLLAFIFILFGCSDRDLETDLDVASLYGSVSKMSEMVYTGVMKDGQLQRSRLKSVEDYAYNDKGYVQYSKYRESDGFYELIYTYNALGQPKMRLAIEADDSVTTQCVLNLDGDDQIEEEIWKTQKGNQEYRLANNYLDGKVIETRVYDHQDALQTTRRFTYNPNGQQDTIRAFSPEDGLYQYTCKEFENKWLKHSELYLAETGQDDNLALVRDFSYTDLDKEGNWTKAEVRVINMFRKDTSYLMLERQLEYYN